MDICDIAQKSIEFLTDVAIHAEVKDDATATGYCLYCGEPVSDGKRWCCVECRDEWEREQKRK